MKRVRRLLVQPEGPRATLTPILSAALLTVTGTAALAAWPAAIPTLRPPTLPLPPAPTLIATPKPVRLIAQAQAGAQTAPAASQAAPAAETTPYRKWITQDVAYIITDQERAAFKQLQTSVEFEQFIQQFWLRRDPTPGTAENEFKEEHYRRVAYANDHYSTADLAGWKTDRGRVYITYGPPDEKEIHPNAVPPNEQWLYRYIAGIGTNIIVEFTDPDGIGEFRMTSDPQAGEAVRRGPMPPAGATVQRLGTGATLISLPLTAFGNHKVSLYGRITTMSQRLVDTFEDLIQGPAPLYTRILALLPGAYHLRITAKDVADGIQSTDSIDFTVK